MRRRSPPLRPLESLLAMLSGRVASPTKRASWKVALCSFAVIENTCADGQTELEINIPHIRTKTFTVLNPLRTPDKHLMDDTDIAGPIFFWALFGLSLMLVSARVVLLV